MASIGRSSLIGDSLASQIIPVGATMSILTLETDVVDVWDVISCLRGCKRRLRGVGESLDARDIRSHADAVVRLQLPELVIRPVSLQQIRSQESFYRSLDTPTAS
jgi:hypothetical protein